MFDCDGVLADSEPASHEAWRQALEGEGIDLDAGGFARWVGTTDAEVARHYAAVLGIDPEDLHEAASRHLRVVLAPGIPAFEDAREALRLVEGVGLPVGVASNSPVWRLEATLAAAGLAGAFRVSVGADEVEEPKPAPHVYLEAARRLGVDPTGCLAVEDSPTGIASARLAGMTVLAVDRGVFAPDLLSGASRVVRGVDPGA